MVEAQSTSALFELATAFGAGFLSSLTPCVYPMIPITLSIFGANEQVSRKSAFLRSHAYVIGIAITYTALGMITARTGMLFGSLLSNSYVVFVLAAFLGLLAFHTLGVLNINMGKLQSKAMQVGGKGCSGALLMGMVSGIVAAPCVGPVLVLILMKAAKAESIFWGGGLLLSYSLGLGMIFLALGTFSGLMHRLPRSGNWLIGVKFLIAVAVVMAAFQMIGALHPEVFAAVHVSLGLSALIIGLLIIAARLAYRHKLVPLQVVTAFALAIVALPAIHAAKKPARATAPGEKIEIAWQATTEVAFTAAEQVQKPVMLDLYADWCAKCRELDELTFSDVRVAESLNSELVPTRLDFTHDSDENDAIYDKYEVLGLPCILFVNSQGEEIPGTRITGFLNPDEFLNHIRRVKAVTTAAGESDSLVNRQITLRR